MIEVGAKDINSVNIQLSWFHKGKLQTHIFTNKLIPGADMQDTATDWFLLGWSSGEKCVLYFNFHKWKETQPDALRTLYHELAHFKKL